MEAGTPPPVLSICQSCGMVRIPSGRRPAGVKHIHGEKMKAVFSVVVLAAMTLRLSAQNFTIEGHFTDVANDTLSIGYVQREPEKRVVDVDVAVDAGGSFTYICEIGQACQAELTIRSSGRKGYLFFVPDFTLKDINGRDLRLSSLFGRGKYIIIDFWGSWCSRCIKGFPAMETYYNRYGERLEIVGVACHDKEERWRAAVAKNRIPWLQVISPDGTTEVRYGVTGYPFKVILSPKGRVIQCFKGESTAFYETLDRLLR